ncbi:MAG: formylglycine-generating enzyme family protein [Symploca sp. SIO2E9]|nr:formylglycine-generating enzyme family protein [Symploca sp. SIO2E9]
MVSSDFLASDFIDQHELPQLLAAAETEGLKIIWIYLSYCLYEETEIEAYQAAHNLSQPLDALTTPQQDKVLRDICKTIKKASLSPTETKTNSPSSTIDISNNEPETFVLRLLNRNFWRSLINNQPSIINKSTGSTPSRPTENSNNSGFSLNLGYGVQLEMVAIPGDIFMMGSPESEAGRYDLEGPQHLVTVASFFMGKYPVTQAQWLRVAQEFPQVNRKLNPNPSHFKGLNLPVEQISWYDAEEFCNRLSQQTGREYRLPTEAEWEYACRAGTTTPYHFGESISPELANFDENIKGTTPVGSFKVANKFGLYDMHGNVWEWCADHWHDNYEGAPSDGQAWLNDGNYTGAVVRGGAWNINPENCRSACRNLFDPGDALNYVIGFRVVCVST